MDPTLTAGLFAVAAAAIGAAIGVFGTYLGSRRVNRKQADYYQMMIDDLKRRLEQEEDTNQRLRAALEEDTRQELSRYLSSVKRELGTWQGGLGLGRAVDLDRVYVDMALRDGDEQFRGDRKADEIFRHLLEADDSGHHHTVIIGGPGTGKSTLLRRWGHTLARNAQNSSSSHMPFFLPLNLFAQIDLSTVTHLGIEELALQHLYGFSYSPKVNLSAALHEYVMQGNAIILLDAVDEIPHEKRDFVVDWINGLTNINPGNLIILTSRPGTYTDPLRQFQTYDMVDFDDDQIRAFVTRWFASMRTTKAPRTQAVDFILGADRVLKGNPLFLTMLCVLVELGLRSQGNGQNAESLLHLTPGALFDRFVHELLEHWPREIKHLTLHVPTHHKLIVLQHLACRLFAEDSRAIAGDSLFAGATAPPSAQAVQEIVDTSGILQLTRNGYYRFYHPLFQEFFVARQVTSDIARGSINFDSWYAEHAWDDRYKSVAAFVPELMDMDKEARR
jgi:predicted NACHT family NTPase